MTWLVLADTSFRNFFFIIFVYAILEKLAIYVFGARMDRTYFCSKFKSG